MVLYPTVRTTPLSDFVSQSYVAFGPRRLLRVGLTTPPVHRENLEDGGESWLFLALAPMALQMRQLKALYSKRARVAPASRI